MLAVPAFLCKNTAMTARLLVPTILIALAAAPAAPEEPASSPPQVREPAALSEPDGPGGRTPQLPPLRYDERFRETTRSGTGARSTGPRGSSRIGSSESSGIGLIRKPEPPRAAESPYVPPATPTIENPDIDR